MRCPRAAARHTGYWVPPERPRHLPAGAAHQLAGGKRPTAGGVNAFLGQWFHGLHPSTPPVGASLRVIPCNTAAQHALLPGFAVADISTITETGMQSLGRTAVAFCPQPFQSGEYEALYGSDFL